MQYEGLTILIVEDDPNDVLFLERAFRKNNINNPIRVAEDGDDAIDYLKGTGRFSDRTENPFPGFILLDLKMPRKSGLEVLEWIKKHPEHMVIPTVVFTSSREDKDIRDAYCAGANSYIVKPVSFEVLQKRLRTIYDYWTVCETPLSDRHGPCP